MLEVMKKEDAVKLLKAATEHIKNGGEENKNIVARKRNLGNGRFVAEVGIRKSNAKTAPSSDGLISCKWNDELIVAIEDYEEALAV